MIKVMIKGNRFDNCTLANSIGHKRLVKLLLLVPSLTVQSLAMLLGQAVSCPVRHRCHSDRFGHRAVRYIVQDRWSSGLVLGFQPGGPRFESHLNTGPTTDIG